MTTFKNVADVNAKCDLIGDSEGVARNINDD